MQPEKNVASAKSEAGGTIVENLAVVWTGHLSCAILRSSSEYAS